MRSNCFRGFFVVIILWMEHNEVFAKNLVVASYNLWNVMFQWDVRKHYIAETIRKVNPDIIGFQEVRADLIGKRNQLKELQALLPDYKYSSYHTTSTIEKEFGEKAITGWEKEGLGILSKHSIVVSHQIPLSKASSKDNRGRALLHVQVEYGMHEVFFIVVHFSTNKMLQCQNALKVMNFIASNRADRTVIAGDFNTYVDYNWPLEAVQNGFFLPNGCPIPPGFKPMEGQYGFDDSWTQTNADKTNFGLTFSNMPFPGLINRPDLILVSRFGLEPVKTTLHGQGYDYEHRYSTKSYISRLKTIINMAKEQWHGTDIEYPCYHDCGPHGSCRCGVCVGGGNTLNCDLPSCNECTASHYNIILMLYYTIYFYIILSIYVLVGVYIKYYSKQRALKKMFPFGKWFRLKYLTLLVVIGIVLFYTVIKVSLSAMIRTALNRIPEEMYPSDHLMVVSEIKLTYH